VSDRVSDEAHADIHHRVPGGGERVGQHPGQEGFTHVRTGVCECGSVDVGSFGAAFSAAAGGTGGSAASGSGVFIPAAHTGE
jgi:hypothetical protein